MKPQAQELVRFFRDNNWTLRLHDLLQTSFASEYRARITELRREGYTVTCQRSKRPGENVYTMIPPEASGQRRFA